MSGVFLFELRYWLRRPVTYIYFLILFLLAFFFVSTDVVQIGGIAGKVKVNSPYSVVFATFILTFIGQIITTAIAGTAVVRDFQLKSHELFFTTPVGRTAYLGGRFFGATIIMFGCYSGILLGILIGSYMPWVDAETIGPVYFSAYAAAFAWALVPNVLLSSALFFAVGTLTRNLFAVYVMGIVLLVANIISSNLTRDLDNDMLSALLDPFGIRAFSLSTRYWSIAEKNTSVPEAGGFLLANRALWTGIALVLFSATMALFRFDVQGFVRRPGKAGAAKKREEAGLARLELPAVTPDFSGVMRFRQFAGLTRFYSLSMIREIPFLAIAAIGILNLVSNASLADSIYGTSVWPVTYIMSEVLQGFILFIIIITTLYAGELIWKERDLKLDQTFDALSLPSTVPMLAKMSALFLTQTVLLILLSLAAMVIQLIKGYTRIEPGLYATDLLMLVPVLLHLIVISFLVHTLVNNKYLGHFLVVMFYVLGLVLPALKIEHGLFDFGGRPPLTYSDMNGYGPFLEGWFWYTLHWTFVAGAFLVITRLFWVRGTAEGFKARVEAARARFRGPVVYAALVLGVLMSASGTWIYYNTVELNEFLSSDAVKKIRADYETRYRPYTGMPHPRITGVRVEADLFPADLRYEMRVVQQAVNRSGQVIDSIFVLEATDVDLPRYEWNRTLTEIRNDSVFGVRLYRVEPPLQPGDSVEIRFTVAYARKGFTDGMEATDIAGNGTFLNSSTFPSFGYNARYELTQDDDRREYKLPERDRVAAIDDTAAWANNYISDNADWIDFETIVSTDPDQTAIAPGYLQREWEENGRRYFHYKMDAPILDFFSILSARYTARRDTFQGKNLEIYYHEPHTYNLDRMMEAMKASLAYYESAFGPYQHRQARILEFPRYASFAQSFPNTIPYSESIGFIARIKDAAKDIDYVYYVTAHEIAHQWWAHQVIGADVQGAAMLSETFSQYSALMVMKQQYGEEAMKKFLSYELDRYLQGRSAERKKELPIMYNEQQSYIYYQKGSLVMYALQDYLGEDRVNRVLSTYLNRVKFQQPPYTTTRDFVSELRRQTPDSLQGLVTDLFETITLYENKADSARFVQNADSTFTVTLTVQAKKLRADSLGNETEVAFTDWMDVGVFQRASKTTSEAGRPLYLQKHKLVPGRNTFTITVKERPLKAGIDPYNKLIDRVPKDNLISVSAAGE